MYTIEQLCAECNVTKWAIYKWRKLGVLPKPMGGRRFAYYTDDHVRIIRAIRKYVHDDRTTLADLAERIHGPKDEA